VVSVQQGEESAKSPAGLRRHSSAGGSCRPVVWSSWYSARVNRTRLQLPLL